MTLQLIYFVTAEKGPGNMALRGDFTIVGQKMINIYCQLMHPEMTKIFKQDQTRNTTNKYALTSHRTGL